VDPTETGRTEVVEHEGHLVDRTDLTVLRRSSTDSAGATARPVIVHPVVAPPTTAANGAPLLSLPANQDLDAVSVSSVPAPSRADRDGGAGTIKGSLRLLRPKQWTKNVLVFVAPAAGGVLLHWSVLWHAAAAFGIFCLAASGTYCLNDAMDVEADRRHPTKRFRPIASGIVPRGWAIALAVALLTGSVVAADLLAGTDLAIVMGLYAAANVGYSMGLKNEPILDLALVCAGFVLRAIAGGVATGVPLSNWFIIVASFGSLMIVTGKRMGEGKVLNAAQVEQVSVRQTLGLYTPDFLRSVLVLSAGVTVTAYCLWAFERASVATVGHQPIWFQLSIVPFVIALLHVVRLLDSGRGAAPEELALHDHRLQVYGACWIALFAVATYG
jgi:decaprenyl-phosphate phosphoribosyltransferase